MNLIPDDLRAVLAANAVRAVAGNGRFDPVPVVKLFNPCGAATWLATEIGSDDDTLFGLADLGFGSPELGTFSLGEIAALRLPFGLRVERDRFFATDFPLSVWADWTRRSGSLLWAETLLNRAALGRAAIRLPPDPD